MEYEALQATLVENTYKLIIKAWFIFIKNIENQIEQRC